jgi:hypothetical protein
MKEIIGYIRAYAREVNKPVLIICTLFIAILIWLNYARGLESWLVYDAGLPGSGVVGHYLLFLVALSVPYTLLLSRRKDRDFLVAGFIVSALIAPFIFALKMDMSTELAYSDHYYWDYYWNQVLYWPPRLLVVLALLAIVRRFFCPDPSFYGLAPQRIKWKPYLLMLLIMIPLIVAASTQPDFLASYPKMREILPLPPGTKPDWLYKIFYELGYGSDFISIEVFFRGFLVIGLSRWAGKDAILPMACFYCTIHFGKPLGECISSYFGGLLLGIVSYHTRSIYGGLMVHLGIAWLMEVGGYFGNYYFG